MRTNPERMKLKVPVNMSLPTKLRDAAEAYAEENGRSLSSLVEDLLRRHLESKGIDVDAPLDGVMERIAEKRAKKSAPGAKKGGVRL